MSGRKLSKISSLFVILLLALSRVSAQSVDEPLFSISIRNTLLEQRFGETRNEEEPVETNILNSDVQGRQSTKTETRIRILPDPSTLRFNLISTGCVSSQTTGINRQVTVDSNGNHQFAITKPFWFDGSKILTQPGYGTILATQAPQRVVSAVGVNMPLLRPLSDRLAWEQVTRRQAEINQAVAKDVSRTVLPKIDRLVDEEFAQLGRQLSRAQSQIETMITATPFDWIARSTESSVFVAAIPKRYDSPEGELNTAALNLQSLTADEEIAVSFSESVGTALLGQFVPAGLILTDSQIEQASTVWKQAGEEKLSLESLSQLYLEIQRNASAEPTMFSIQLAKVQPIAIRFDRGFVCVDTSFQIVPKIGPSSGWMKVTWRLRGRGISKDQWAIVLQQVDVSDSDDSIPLGSSENSQQRAARQDLQIPIDTTFVPNATSNGAASSQNSEINSEQTQTIQSGTVWMTIVKNATQALLKQSPPVTLPKEFDAPDSVPGAAGIRMVRIETADGILRAAFRIVDDPVQP